jgi:hypothetical protein
MPDAMVTMNSAVSYQGTRSSGALSPPGKIRKVKGSMSTMSR